MKPHVRLRELRDARGLSYSAAARAVGATHVSWINWESGESPSDPYRRAIERWSDGAILAADWPPTAGEKRLALRIEAAEEQREATTTDPAPPADPVPGAA